MARIAPIPPEKMTDVQRRFADSIAAQGRSVARGPFSVLIREPALAEYFGGLGDHFLKDTLLPHTAKEIAILTVARGRNSQYEWWAHEKRARDVGVPDVVIEAIRTRRRPDLADPVEAIAHEVARETVAIGKLVDPLYARAVELLGEPALVELVAIVGLYVAIALVIEAFEIGVPDGEKDPLPA